MFASIRSRSTIMLGVSRSSSVSPILGAYMVGDGDAVGGRIGEDAMIVKLKPGGGSWRSCAWM
jgi:hypothetical protein